MSSKANNLFKVAKLGSRYYKIWLENRLLKNKITYPLSIDFFITYRCNLNCYFCWQKKEKDFCGIKEEIGLKEIKKLVAELKNKNLKIPFSFSGGEPFVRSDMLDILEYLDREGIELTIATNGTLLNKEKILRLMKLKNLTALSFSIDGDEKTHDKLRGIKGSYKKTLNAIRLLREEKEKSGRKFPEIVTNFVVTGLNLDQLESVVQVSKELGTTQQFTHLNYITEAMLGAHKNYLKSQLRDISKFPLEGNTASRELLNLDIEKFTKRVEELRKIYPNIKVQPELNTCEMAVWYNPDNNSKVISKCIKPLTEAIINPNGEVIPCPMINYPLGNIKNQSFFDIWKGKKRKKFIGLLKKNWFFPGCQRCSCGLLKQSRYLF